MPVALKQSLNLNQGYTYSKFVRFEDFYLFSDFTFRGSLGRVAIIKNYELIGEILGYSGRQLLGQYLWIGQDVITEDEESAIRHILIGVTSRQGPRD